MCGLVGIATRLHRHPAIDAAGLGRLRDLLSHRGPDGAGLWDGGHVILGHRRLAVIDLSPEAAQPFHASNDAGVIVYNGELYNEPELRARLAESRVPLRTHSDTEVLIESLTRAPARDRSSVIEIISGLRGMFAFAFLDRRTNTLTLARDPLGIKPLYWTRLRTNHDGPGVHIAFASEVSVLAELIRSTPGSTLRPDMQVVSGYLTTIRTTLDDRTLFDGIKIVRPGEILTFDLNADELPMERSMQAWRGGAKTSPHEPHDSASTVASCVRESLHRHLRADVPVCCLLSGGLDSSITAALAARHVAHLQTFCAGASSAVGSGGDFDFAREMATLLKVQHTEVEVCEHDFQSSWPDMVERLGLPLSTPNEVAIRAVARRLRAEGFVVAVSGEGADELFAGYDLPLRAVIAASEQGPLSIAGLAQTLLANASWIPIAQKSQVLSPEAFRAIEGDQALTDFVMQELASCAGGLDDDVRSSSAPSQNARPGVPHRGASSVLATETALNAAQRWIRRMNLEGLLLRLDTAMMLEGVEGRTPFADVAVQTLAESLPLSERFDPNADDDLPATKRVLRRAFADVVPANILRRPKASFPLPFQGWMGAGTECLRSSRWLSETVRPEVLRAVEASPGTNWTLAWPLINLGLWARRWWG